MKKRFYLTKCKAAFTLAEVLITLAVIGIVAALTIGIFLPKIHSQIRAHQIAVAETKFTKAMEQMALNNAIGPYYENTQEFVDELQNYLKVSKVCDNEHLADCFGYEKIKLNNGEEFEIKEIKTGENLGMGKKYAETIGIVTIDGTGMILSWNKECPILEPKVYPWGNNTNETTSCVAMVMDVNLDKSPNTQNKDVALFRAESIADSCGISFTVGNKKYCWGEPFAPVSLPKSECESKKDELGILNCRSGDYPDYWAGAVNHCGHVSKMPDIDALRDLAIYLFGTEDINEEGYTDNITMDETKLEKISNTLFSYYSANNMYKAFALWSGTEDTSHDYEAAYARAFKIDWTARNNCDYGRSNAACYAVCTN